ncbi:MAG: hypothetical protein VCD00_19935 [Candidatus Hydrogenedentota bacterium]
MNFLRALMISIAISPLAVAADWSTDVALVKDMVVLDKAYIPALMAVRKGDAARAEEAVEQLDESWGTFQSTWGSEVSSEWRSGFEGIDLLVSESKEFVAARDFERAYATLDEIRHAFAELREKEGISYFLDFVTSTETALDEVVRTVSRDLGTPLSPKELDVVETGLLLAQKRWKVVTDTRIDKIVYRIDIYYMGDLASTRSDGTLLLKELTRDARKMERATLAEKIAELTGRVEHFLEILGATPGS